MSEINMDASTEELVLIEKIMIRAFKKPEIRVITTKLFLMMDITAAHCNGCRLDLKKFLDAPDAEFFHDVVGIMYHLSRETGKLKEPFEPRCAYVTHV